MLHQLLDERRRQTHTVSHRDRRQRAFRRGNFERQVGQKLERNSRGLQEFWNWRRERRYFGLSCFGHSWSLLILINSLLLLLQGRRQSLVLFAERGGFAQPSHAFVKAGQIAQSRERLRLGVKRGFVTLDRVIVLALLAVDITEIEIRAGFADGDHEMPLRFVVIAFAPVRQPDVVVHAAVVRRDLQPLAVILDGVAEVVRQVARIAEVIQEARVVRLDLQSLLILLLRGIILAFLVVADRQQVEGFGEIGLQDGRGDQFLYRVVEAPFIAQPDRFVEEIFRGGLGGGRFRRRSGAGVRHDAVLRAVHRDYPHLFKVLFARLLNRHVVVVFPPEQTGEQSDRRGHRASKAVGLFALGPNDGLTVRRRFSLSGSVFGRVVVKQEEVCARTQAGAEARTQCRTGDHNDERQRNQDHGRDRGLAQITEAFFSGHNS